MAIQPGESDPEGPSSLSPETAKKLLPIVLGTLTVIAALTAISAIEVAQHSQAWDSDSMLSLFVGAPALAVGGVAAYFLHRRAQA